MGVLRRAAPVPADRTFVKRSLGAAAVPSRRRSVVARQPSTCPVGAVPSPTIYTKAKINEVHVDMEIITVGGGGSGDTFDAHPSLKRQREVAADQGQVAPPIPKYTKVMRNGVVGKIGGGEKLPNARASFKRPLQKPARRDGVYEDVSVPDPERCKVTSDGVDKPVHAAIVDPTLGILRKRMAVELDALHALVRKAQLLSRSKKPMEAANEAPAAKRMKVSPLGNVADEEDVLVDICGGVSPIAIRSLSSVVSVMKMEETMNRKSRVSPEDEDAFVDVCGGVSPVAIQETYPVKLSVEDGEAGNSPRSSGSESESSSSSESDSDSSSDSDSDSDSSSDSESDSDTDSDDETADSPASPPPVVLPEENSTAAQSPPPEPLASVAMRSTELDGGQVSYSATELVQSAELEDVQPGLIYRAELRQTLLEMESAVLPDESIHARELQSLGIAEYGRPRVMKQLGLLHKDDAPPTAGKFVASKQRSAPKMDASVARQPSPSPAKEVVQRAEPNKNVQAEASQPGAPKEVCMRGLLYRAKLRLTLQEMERAVLPDESIRARDLRRLCIAEYGRPSVMQQLGLFLDA